MVVLAEGSGAGDPESNFLGVESFLIPAGLRTRLLGLHLAVCDLEPVLGVPQ